MAYRKAHGTGKSAAVRIEVLPPDELPRPIPAPEAEPASPVLKDELGRFADKDSAKEAGRRGGVKSGETKRRAKFLREMGFAIPCAEFSQYHAAGEEFIAQHLTELAKMAGGMVGSGPTAIVRHAGWLMAVTAFYRDKLAQSVFPDPKLAKEVQTMGDSMRQNLLAAYELAVKEAQVRPKNAYDPLAAFMEPANKI